MIKFLQRGGKAQKIILGGVLVLISGLMVISLIPGGLMGNQQAGAGQGNLARVAGEDVSALDVQQAARNMGQQRFSGNVPDQLMPYLIQQAADQLISGKALIAEAHRLGLRVTDEELRDRLRQGEFGQVFFPGGNFVGQDQYEAILEERAHMGVRQFEDQLRNELLTGKLLAMIGGAISVSDAEVEKEFQKQNTKVKLRYAVLTTADLEKQVKTSDAELRAFFDKNKARYQNAIAEKRKADYVIIDRAKIVEQAKSQITDAQLVAYYNHNRDGYRVPERVKVRHILIKTPVASPDGKVDEKAVASARAKAEDVLKQLRGGGNFAELAKKYSEDSSAKDGGELGWIGRGRTVAEFERTAFSLPPGQTSGLVQTQYGFHIIQVEAREEAHSKPFQEAREQILQQLAQDKAAAGVDALAAKVESEARTRGLEKAASDNGLQVTHSDWVGQTDSLPGAGNSPELLQAAFSAQVKGPPTSVRVSEGYVVLQVVEKQPPRTPTFEEWRSHVEEDFKRERAAAMLTQKSRELADRAHALHDLARAAKEVGAAVKTSELVTINGQVPDVGSMSGPAAVAFDMKPGEISQNIQTASGGVVFEVMDKQLPTQAEIDKGKEQVREQLVERKRQEQVQVFVAGIRERMEKAGQIRINREEWNRLTGGSRLPLGS